MNIHNLMIENEIIAYFKDHQFNENFSLENEYINVVIFGNIKSNYDLTFKVNNLVVLGEIKTTGKIILEGKEDVVLLGPIKGEPVITHAKWLFQDKVTNLDEKTIEKMKKLGIEVIDKNQKTYTVPNEIYDF